MLFTGTEEIEEAASAEAVPEVVLEPDDEETEAEIQPPKRIRFWNILLLVVVGIIILLVILFLFLFRQQETSLDLSLSYAAENADSRTLATAPAFSQNLVVSDPSVVLDGVTLDASTEKALLFDLDAGRACFAQGIYDKVYPASLTKIMTAILAMKYGNMSDVIVMTEEDFALEEGSQVSGMRPGDTVTMDQLFHALVVYSANDAAMAIARHIGGSVENFTARMNEEARALGMTGTHFVNPHGLHDSEHYTCAYDVYLMLNEAVRYTAFTDAIRMNVYNLKVTRADGSEYACRLDSTDKYLTGEKKQPEGITLWGGKTGTTPEAGSCLALAAQNRNGIPYMAVILNARNSAVLYEDMNQLLGMINQI